ncbi:hypothetical protein, partial [Paracidovorax cattleyae]|uniref:hypothetical protein n=1 Tax=Paracidovorax cattleyae TaxID=80868 RepID=UPI0018AF56C3
VDWNRVADLGRSIDPENPLYQPGGRPPVLDDDAARHLPAEGFQSTLTTAARPPASRPSERQPGQRQPPQQRCRPTSTWTWISTYRTMR